MKRIACVVALGVLTFCLSACVRGVNVKVAGEPGRPVFSLHGAPLTGGRACFTDIAIYPDGAHNQEAIWEIRSQKNQLGNAKCLVLSRLEYGVTPSDFAVKTPPEPLDLNATYRIGVHGDGWYSQVRFTYQGGKYRLVK